MIRVYAVIRCSETRYSRMNMRALEGYSFSLQTAQLYVATHEYGYYEIMTYEDEYHSEIFKQIYEDHGCMVGDDIRMMIRIIPSHDGKYHIAETTENLENTLYEVGTFEQVINETLSNYLQISKIMQYVKDNSFKLLMSHIATRYFGDLVNWLEGETYPGYVNDKEYPLDIVTTLVMNEHVTPIEYIKGDSTSET